MRAHTKKKKLQGNTKSSAVKVTKKLEAEATKVYDTWLHSYLNGDVKTYDYFLDKDYHFIGSTDNEDFLPKEETTKFFKNTADQLAGKCQIKNNIRNIEQFGNLVFITERFDANFLIGKKWTYYGKFRFSSVMHKTKEGWRFIYQHFSMPDSKAMEGETLGAEQVSKENQELRDAIKRRTAELEIKNRELEIETSLEKVRTVAMGMKGREDMLKICKTISLQLKKLGVKEIRNVQTAIFYPDKGTYMNYEYYAKHNKTIITDVSFTNNKIHKAFAAKMLKGKGEFYITQIKGRKKVDDWIAYQKTTNVFIDKYLKTAPSLNYHWYSLGPVSLGISTYQPLAEKEKDLFKRFVNVFELAYRRYLDIEKAEAQARETKIELGLERVRARAMAMHKSEELAELIDTVQKELTTLEFNLNNCIFWIMEKDPPSATWWVAPVSKTSLPESYFVPFTNLRYFNEVFKAWQKRISIWRYELQGADKKKTDNYIFNKTELKRIPSNVRQAFLKEEKVHISFSFYNYGGLHISTPEPLTEEQLDIINRFSRVFDMTYTRFLDLQKAEAQAREAEIEVALERVRAKTMAMHKSEELLDTAVIISNELIRLSMPHFMSGFVLVKESVQKQEGWLRVPGRESKQRFYLPLKGDSILKERYESWKRREPLFFQKVSGEKLKKHLDYVSEYFESDEATENASHFPEQVIFYSGNFKEGYLHILSEQLLTTEQELILSRFTKVFQQTYTRFLDLQKAEAQAREGQIQLALERVRARTMAMHNSSELLEAASLLYHELFKLGIPTLTSGYVLMDEEKKIGWNYVIKPPEGTVLPKPIGVPQTETEVMRSVFNSWKKQEPYCLRELDPQATIRHHRYLAENSIDFPVSAEELLSVTPERLVFYAFNFRQGYLLLSGGSLLTADQVEMMVRFAKVFELTYRRFLDLKKAEAQAREAQIETALERVRSRSLAMHNSDELNDVVMVLFERLKDLGIPATAVGITTFLEGSKDMNIYVCGDIGDGLAINHYLLPYFDHRIANEYYNVYQKQLELFVGNYSKEEKNSFYKKVFKLEALKDLPVEIKKMVFNSGSYTITMAGAKNSMLAVNNFAGEQLSQNEIDIVKRFAKVFDQAYIRFLDLQKAEAQAREAQIEASLERIRSRTMGMHRSNELKEIVALLYEECNRFGFGSFLIILNTRTEKDDGFHWWLSTTKQTVFTQSYYIPDIDEPVFEKLRSIWKSGKPFGHLQMSGKVKAEHDRRLFSETGLRDLPGHLKEKMLSDKSISISIANMKNGFIEVADKEFISEGQMNILLRYARVFEQTYSRFLDLQKAEAQAREAEIQLALERVRARTMAMHSSSELAEAASVLFQQLLELDLKPVAFGFIIMDEKAKSGEVFISADGTVIPDSFILPYHGEPAQNKIFNSWKKKEPYVIVDLKGKKLETHLHFIAKNMPVFDMLKSSGTKQPDRLALHMINFHHGCLGINYPEPNEGVVPLLIRFAKVFEQTYTRFLDLQKAEAQAKEAKIEAALERVRSRSLAMHHSSELSAVVETLLTEFTRLEFTLTFCIINLINEQDRSNTVWAANPETGKQPESYYMKFEDYPFHHAMWNAWKNQEKRFIYTIEGEEKKIYDEYLYTDTEFRRFPKHVQDANKVLKRYVAGFTFFKYSGLQTVSENFISEEDLAILERFGRVFEQSYTRFLDLQKAEAQVREAQIEAALERVRSRTMGMQHSDELKDAALLLFQQIQSLGTAQWACGFDIWDNDMKTSTVWIGSATGFHSSFKTDSSRDIFKPIYEAAQRGESLFVVEQSGKELEEHYNYMASIPVFKSSLLDDWERAGIPIPTFQIFHAAFFKQGYLIFISFEPIPTFHDIFIRFAKVFEQTYTRFLDLQRAEAQAREAQIEAALERVRSRSMAMHHTSELQDVIKTVHEQLTSLNIAITGGAFIAINEENKDKISCWGAGNTADYVELVQIPFLDRPIYIGLLEVIQEGPGLYTQEYSYEEKMEFFDHLFSISPYCEASAEHKNEIMSRQGGYTRSAAVSKYTSVSIINHHGRKFTEEENNILVRFGNVFEQSYTRFLDLQRAEAQSREAEIQLALERVRARTMAMHNSSELAEVAVLLFEQIKHLGVESFSSGFNIWDDEYKNLISWMSNATGEINPPFKLPIQEYEQHQRIFTAWKKKELFLEDDLQGEALTRHYKFLRSFPLLDQSFKQAEQAGIKIPDRQVHNVTFFSNGYLLFITQEPMPQYHSIFQRFGKVFDQTYTRFLDLKKAEAQAVQAEKDLVEIKAARKKAEEALKELQVTQKQLIQSEKMASLGELTAGIAHEIQNPLNFVNNFSEVSKEMLDEIHEELEKGNTESIKELIGDISQNLEKITHHGKRADGIVKGMLQHSRSSSGQKELTDINVLADEYLRLAFHGLRAKDKSFNAKFETHFGEGIVKLKIVPQDIGRVILNLINNAFYACAERSRSTVNEKQKAKSQTQNAEGYEPIVVVSTKNEDGKVIISVKDNGNGIPDAIKEKIFQPFFTTKPTGEGTGLGLSLSYDIIKAHAGEFKVETKEGEGSTFIISLPTNNN